MNLNEIIGGSAGVLIVILTLVEIVPIKINPWTALFKAIGKACNADTNKKIDNIVESVDKLSKSLSELKEEDARKEAQDCRYRILRFADECYLQINHSQEHYKQILQDCTTYDQYCESHPNFPNQVAVVAIDQIKRSYAKHMENRDFLQ